MTELNNPRSEFEMLLQSLKRNRGFDFTGYKRNSVMRRVEKRMSDVGVEAYSQYAHYLEVHPEEFSHLFNTILINVTAFFRDPASWDHIRDEVIPRILASKGPDDPVRVWSAGCASGEEAYSLAMLLAEAVGVDRFQDRVKIYATDIDEEALAEARHAGYTAREVIGVPPDYLDRYFVRTAARYTVRKELRRVVIFDCHDLIQDAPIPRIDLLVCRNAIMYFHAEIQAKILARLHFALNDAGYLFLGKAETLFKHSSLFTPVDLKLRIFSKVTNGTLPDIQVAPLQELQGELEKAYEELQATNEELQAMNEEMRQSSNLVSRANTFLNAVLSSMHGAVVVMNREVEVQSWNSKAEELWGLSAKEVQGKHFFSLDIGLPVDQLKQSIHACLAGGVTSFEDVIEATHHQGKAITFKLTCTPLVDGEDLCGVIMVME
ncbi:MAG: CheR family methyltransferase [Capsulimonas sp.]|uniref:CheR family methyltransferase n=1 Tax=Capsulimonas sp. TaxID=2494211 RepID=UPI0032649FCF